MGTRRNNNKKKTRRKKYTRRRIQRGGNCVLDTDGTILTKPYIKYRKMIRVFIDMLARYFVWARQMLKDRFKSKKCVFDPTELSEQAGKFFGWGAFMTSNGSIRWPGIEPGYNKQVSLSFCNKKNE